MDRCNAVEPGGPPVQRAILHQPDDCLPYISQDSRERQALLEIVYPRRYNAAVMSASLPVSSISEPAVAIVGVGLIGGSIAAALRRRGYNGRIWGIGRTDSRLQAAQEAGLIDTGTTDPAAADVSLWVFCTPVDRIVGGVREAAARSRAGTLLTDAGSIKRTICEDLSTGLPSGVTFVGSHPLAGSEQQGFEHADAELFAGRVTVVTPDETTPPAELQRLRRFWEFLGSRVIEMPADEHDRMLARTSHLPHVVSAALAGTFADLPADLTAGGYRDTTRIAAGDADLWASILLGNAEAIVSGMDCYRATFVEFRQAIARGDAAALKSLLQTAKRNRDAIG